jgi:PPM family protein phosphatase
MKFSVYKVSHKGGRAKSTKTAWATYTREAVLLVLADGMGGHPEGRGGRPAGGADGIRPMFHRQATPALSNVPVFSARR